MKTQRRRAGSGTTEMPLSSMIDVVFLLLIYFLAVQTPIIESVVLDTSLPGGRSDTKQVMRPGIIRIDIRGNEINDDNPFYVLNGSRMSDENLFNRLETLSRDAEDTPVIIRCSTRSEHQRLVRLLDACSKYQLQNINIVAAPSENW